jgi:predicted permease
VTTVAIVSLSLAIGGNAAVFSMVDAFIFRPPPFPEPERVVLFGEARTDQPSGSPSFTTSLPTWADLKERSRTVEEWAALQFGNASVRGPERSEAVTANRVTPSFFDVVRARVLRGRTFLPAEGVEGGPGVVVISHPYWVERWGEGEDPLGDVLVVDGEPREVVGVLPPDFGFLGPPSDVWLPLTRNPLEADRTRRNVFTVGRMAPSANMEQIRSEMSSLAAQLADEHPEALRNRTVDAYNLRDDLPTAQTRILFGLLQGSVVVVLLIACVNITNLLLARSRERGREMALRTVLGAGRGRIARQLVTESGVLVGVSALIGLGLGSVGIEAISRAFAGLLPPNFEPALDHRVLLFTVGVAVLAGISFGLLPVAQAFRTDHASALRDGGARGGSGRSRKALSRALVVCEIALSFVALGGGSMLVRSFVELRAGDPGFDGSALLTASVQIPGARYEEGEERRVLARRLLESIGRVPGVHAAALASAIPQSPQAPSDTFRVSGEAVEAGVPAPRAVVVRTSPGYASTLGIEVLRGRFFTDADGPDDARVAVVDQALARARFGNESPLGRQVRVAGEAREIVGVVEDVVQQIIQVGPAATSETIYLPREQDPQPASLLMVRTQGDPAGVAEPLRQALRDVDRDVALANVLTMEEYVDQFFVGVNVFNLILGGFGIMALLMASLGTYGVLAYTVGQRRREIGIRMAVGAEPRGVVLMIARGGIVMGAVGLALGVLMTLPLVGLLRSLLQNLSTVRPATLGSIAAVLFAVTVAASLLPARRASAVDPVRTLKGE